MELAKDKYETLEEFLGIDSAKLELNELTETEAMEYGKLKRMIKTFDEMKENAIRYEFLKEMYILDKIKLDDDFSVSYEEYKNKEHRTNCLMTKFEFERMKEITYGKNNSN